jgi:hypothetical protein
MRGKVFVLGGPNSRINKSLLSTKAERDLGSWLRRWPERVPEGHMTVARRFIAGFGITWGCVSEGRPNTAGAINPKHIQSQTVRKLAGVFLGVINRGEGISAISSLNLDEASVVHALPHAFGQSAGGKKEQRQINEMIRHNFHIHYNRNNLITDRS